MTQPPRAPGVLGAHWHIVQMWSLAVRSSAGLKPTAQVHTQALSLPSTGPWAGCSALGSLTGRVGLLTALPSSQGGCADGMQCFSASGQDRVRQVHLKYQEGKY